MRRKPAGFGLVTAIFLLVVLAGLGAAIVFVGGLQQSTATLDLLGSRAYQAARAGVEWGAFQSLRNGACSGTTLTFAGTALDGFTAAVSCTRTTADEAGVTINIDEYVALACNQPPCPQPSPGNNYAERQLRLVVGK
jgi:MSHA biogenesis protein MshP